MSLNKLKTTLIAWTFALSSACSIVPETKNNVDNCLNCDNTTETTEIQKTWIDRFINEFNKSKGEFESVEDFRFFSSNLVKKHIPEIGNSFEKWWKNWFDKSKVISYFFENNYFIDTLAYDFVKIEKKIDVKTYVPELTCLFWDIEKLEYAKIWIIPKSKNKWQMGISSSWVWIIHTSSLKEAYWDNYLNGLKTTIANEATHSILTNYYRFHGTEEKFGNSPIITQLMVHEYLSNAWSFCVNETILEGMVSHILNDIKIRKDGSFLAWNLNFKTYSWSNVNYSNYLYSNNSLLKLLLEIDKWSWMIVEILKEQYKINNDNNKNNNKSIFKNTKKILSLLSKENINNIRLTFINEWRAFQWLTKIEFLEN